MFVRAVCFFNVISNLDIFLTPLLLFMHAFAVCFEIKGIRQLNRSQSWFSKLGMVKIVLENSNLPLFASVQEI